MIRFGGQPGSVNALTRAATIAILAALKATGAILDAVDLRLYTEGPTLTSDMQWTDFTELVGGAYAAKTPLVWGTPGFDDGKAEMISYSPAPTWIADGTTVNGTVKGFAIVKTVEDVSTVIYAEDFPEPQVFATAGDIISCPPVVNAASAE